MKPLFKSGILGLMALILIVSGTRAASTDRRSGLFLKGAGFQGLIQWPQGGRILGEIETSRPPGSPVERKHIVRVHYEPITVQVGLDMRPAFYDWISQAFNAQARDRNGKIVFYDFNYQSKDILEFHDARIHEVTFPGLDLNNRNPFALLIRIRPGLLRNKPGTGLSVPVIHRTAPGRAAWLCSNFRVSLGNLPCGRVSGIDSFTFTLQDSPGEKTARSPVQNRNSSLIAFVPNLRLRISMADIKPWREWHRSFVIEGRNSQADELQGRIEIISPDRRRTIVNIGLFNVGILSLNRLNPEGAQNPVLRFEVELYVEQMTFRFHGNQRR